jgi:parallel beta-helix repeat protein
VNKTLSLIGENRNSTILNGTTPEPILVVRANNTKISGFAFEGWVFQDIVINATTGVMVTDNEIVFNAIGIDIQNSVNSTIKNNIIRGFGLDNIGIMLFYSSECKITNNEITNAIYDGIRLWFSSNNLIHQNLFKENDYGIYFHGSNLNEITENTISESRGPGISIDSSSNNEIFHNNFMEKFGQPRIYDNSVNAWDNGLEGNYWSDSNTTDVFRGPYQNETGSDGIGDSGYCVNLDPRTSPSLLQFDRYPLMGMFNSYDALNVYNVTVISNSTVSNFITPISIEHPELIFLYFSVTGAEGTTGFCRVSFPTAMMNGTYHVFVDWFEVPYALLPCSDANYSYLYFTYGHSTETVSIMPEFPSLAILLLFMTAVPLALIVTKWKRRL